MAPERVLKTPQALLRGVFLSAALLVAAALPSCDQQQTPTWQESEAQTNTPEPTPPNLSPKKSKAQKAAPASEIRFLAYNLKNYLSMQRSHPVTRERAMLPKPEKEINALIALIKQADPHILGICEIGTRTDLSDLKNRLTTAGLDFPHSHFAAGADPYRRLAILSKFPLTPHPSPNLEYRMRGETHLVNRGIIDATIHLPNSHIRFMGAHLKSKRKVENYDEAIIRRNEANVLRQHITKVLTAKLETPLMVYGDFNDSKRSPSIRAIKGPQSGPLSLYYLDLKAPDGSKWTHHWAYEDIYSRFDYVFVSPKLRKKINTKKSRIIAPAPYDPASDHRPLLVIIKD